MLAPQKCRAPGLARETLLTSCLPRQTGLFVQHGLSWGVGARAPRSPHLQRSRSGTSPAAAAAAAAARTAVVAPEHWWLCKRAELASLTASRDIAGQAPAAQLKAPAALADAPAQAWWLGKRAALAYWTAGDRADSRSSSDAASSVSSSNDSNNAAAGVLLPPQAPPAGFWPTGRLGPASPELAAALAPLAAACSADHAALTRAVACLPPGPLQQGVLQHGCAVARHLCNLGCTPRLLAALLSRCLLLFASPPEQHAAPLLTELVAAGLTVPEAARCLERCPAAAGADSFTPAVAALAGLLAAAGVNSSSGDGSAQDTQAAAHRQPGSRQPRLHLAGDLLRVQPEAAQLLRLPPAELRRHARHLLSLGLTAAQLAAALSVDGGAALLALSAEELDERAEVLEEELGGGPAFFAALLHAGPAMLAESDAAEVLEPHAAALAEVRSSVAALMREGRGSPGREGEGRGAQQDGGGGGLCIGS